MRLSQINDTTLNRMYDSKHTMILRGAPGIAKTARIKQYAEDNGMGYVCITAPASECYDWQGLMVPRKLTDGTAVTVNTVPNWLMRIQDTGLPRGILCVDEILSAEHDIQKAVSPIFCERQIGEHVVPEGWVVWGTGNRTVDKAGALKMLAHLTNKVCVLDVEPDQPAWEAWATENNVHPLVVAFAKQFPGTVFNTEPPKDPNEPRCTPRSLTYANDFLARDSDELHLPNDEVTQQVVAGFIGKGASAELFGYLKVADVLPTKEEILADPLHARLPPEERFDAQHAVCAMLVHYANKSNVDPLLTYGLRLAKEMQTSLVQQLVNRDHGALLNTPILVKWLAENAALVTASLRD